MKKYFILIIVILVFNHVRAQNIEISVQANSGLFHYAGNGAASASFINQGQSPNQDYTNNPYGNKNAFSYGAGMQAQHVGKSGFIIGLQGTYEVLRSKVDITGYYPFYIINFYSLNSATYPLPAKGEAFLQNQAINLSPYLGYRVHLKNISLDLLPGMDIAFNVSSYDKGKATEANTSPNQSPQTYQTNFKRPDAPTDIRLRFGLAANYKRVAITAGYAHGLTNYDKNMTGGNYSVHSELIRFGIAYKLFNAR
jgi:hypothetical protein